MATEQPAEIMSLASRTPIWKAHSNLDPILLEIVASAIYEAPPSHLLPPKDGEIFDYPDAALEHLQNWAMAEGFTVVQHSREQGNAAKSTPMRVRWQCAHHGTETTNKQGLENHVEKDEKSCITSQHKQKNITVSQMSCK